uniref:Palmitoyltransferase n=1 Tax=Romanomermis culicivorax TaxID=13658 RepID=A0A915KDS5_ROMCU
MEPSFRQKQFFRLRLCNFFGVAYVFSLVFTLFYVGCFKICPELYYFSGEKSTSSHNFGSCSTPFYFGLFIIVELTLNFLCFHFYGSKFNRVESLSKMNAEQNFFVVHSQNAKFCDKCRKMTPHRTYHCPLCQFCVLKKDHHCFMMGGCAGYGNLRYFIVFLFWAAVGTVYGLWYILRYLHFVVGPILTSNFFSYLAPIAFLKYVAGNVSFSMSNLAIIFLLNFTFMGLLASLAFLSLQIAFILNDRTMYERMKCLEYSSPCERDYRRRLAQIFGKFFLLNFLCPTPFKNDLDPCFSRFLDEFELKCV